MKHSVASRKEKSISTPLVFALFSNDRIKKHFFFPKFSKGDATYLSDVAGDFKAEFGACEVYRLPGAVKSSVILFGLGERSSWSLRKLALAARKLTQSVQAKKLNTLCVCIDDYFFKGGTPERTAEVFATNVEMATYAFTRYKEAPKEGWPCIDEVTYEVKSSARAQALTRALDIGSLIGRAVNDARELSNTPGCDMTPILLAKEAQKRAKNYKISCKVLGEKEMGVLKMGGILAVSRGSKEEAQFIIMEYWGGAKSGTPYVFIGKGITFDSGGLHIKPWNAMDDMFMDMSGGAAVIAAISAIASMKLRVNVVGLVPAVENMPSGESFRPGDIITSMAGKTIEIGSPDAEGRVVLADALTYAKRYAPSLVIDVATLTGSCAAALGHHASAVLSPKGTLVAALEKAGEASGDYVWPLPMWEEYEADVKGVNADLNNGGRGKGADTINGAQFLKPFAGEFSQWAHIDIASTMTTHTDQYLSKGASGSGTRLLIEIARQFQKFSK